MGKRQICPDVNVSDTSDTLFYMKLNKQEQIVYPLRNLSTVEGSGRNSVRAWVWGWGKCGRIITEETAHRLWRGEFGVKNNFCNVKSNKKNKI